MNNNQQNIIFPVTHSVLILPFEENIIVNIIRNTDDIVIIEKLLEALKKPKVKNTRFDDTVDDISSEHQNYLGCKKITDEPEDEELEFDDQIQLKEKQDKKTKKSKRTN